MKKNLLLIMLVITSMIANAQNCFWAKRAGGINSEEGKNLTTDINGNVYVIGTFLSNTITFGSATLTNSNGTEAYFIVKYDAGGNVQWANNATGIARAFGITTDNSGNVYVSGYFDGTSATFGGITLNNLGAGDFFILKYDSSGTVLWAKGAGGFSGAEEGNSISVDNSGNLFVTGKFFSDSISIGTTKLYNKMHNNTPDIFIAKYDASNGNPIWARSAGGNREDIVNGVISDGNGNSCITGAFRSDSVKFGGTTLHSTTPGAYIMFITKYDSIGNVVWTKGIEGLWGDVIGYDIKIDIANNIYIAGEFQGVSAKFGNDSLINHSSGSSDVFVAKYDSNGNAIWARSGGGGNYDYSRHLSVDGIGNVYTIGGFTSTSAIFGNDTLANVNGANYNTFIAKYSTSGTIQWVKNLGNVAYGRGIAAGLGDNIYFTGEYGGALSLGNVTLTCAGQYDFFVADIYNFNSGIVSSTNVTCYGGNDGSILTNASGGNLPYTYSWSTTPSQTTPDVSNLTAGNYSVTITESYGCAQTSNVTITEPPAASPEICMVTVDSLSQHNIIIWDKTSFTTVDSFVVYREISTNNYQPIAVVAFDSLSQFTDTVRTRYFPNTGDPNAGTYRYKIQAKNTCGNSGPISPYHNTIYILNSSGTFYWIQLYTIEGGANPVSSYVLMRDDNSTGNWHSVNSVSGTQQTINDPLYAIYQNTASWRIETQWSINCTSTRSFSTSLSNRYTNNLTVGVNEKELSKKINLYPNPNNGKFSIDFSEPGNYIIEITSSLGTCVYKDKITANKCTVNVTFRSGFYIIKITDTDRMTSTFKKITVQ